MVYTLYFTLIDQLVGGGESVCSNFYVLIAKWLSINPKKLPTKNILDSLIQQGYKEWNRLKEIPSFIQTFLDGYFDLNFILDQKLQPFTMDYNNSK